MHTIMIAPNRYIQGPGVLKKIGDHIRHLGQKAFFIGGPTAIFIVRDCAAENLKENSIQYVFETFKGTCTRAGALGLSEKARDFGADMIVGTGGGKGAPNSREAREPPFAVLETSTDG